MILETQKPAVIRMAYRQEKTDPNYGTCLWAWFDFDPEEWTIQIMSDCGNYAARWFKEPLNSFLKFTGEMDREYFLNKISSRSVLNKKETLDLVQRELEDIGELPAPEEELIQSLRKRIKEAGVMIRMNQAEEILKEWQEYWELDIDNICECIELDYNGWSKRIADIFINHVQPELWKLAE